VVRLDFLLCEVNKVAYLCLNVFLSCFGGVWIRSPDIVFHELFSLGRVVQSIGNQNPFGRPDNLIWEDRLAKLLL
jgi:hypothetical protein